MDGRNPAPPKEPWSDDPLVKTDKQRFPMVSWVVQDFAQPQYISDMPARMPSGCLTVAWPSPVDSSTASASYSKRQPSGRSWHGAVGSKHAVLPMARLHDFGAFTAASTNWFFCSMRRNAKGLQNFQSHACLNHTLLSGSNVTHQRETLARMEIHVLFTLANPLNWLHARLRAA